MKLILLSVFALFSLPVFAAAYDWQEPQARVLPQGDLEWAPRPFVFEAGDSVRYIDFESGSDANDGLSKAAPWKHHPWDSNAEDKAAACRGIHTYVFKRGVIYRGTLKAAESGTPGHPIRLTSDPAWGEGEALLYGSERTDSGWTRCTAETAPGIPEPEKVWMRDFGADWRPWSLYERRDGSTLRIVMARDPDWTISFPDDPQQEWNVWTGWEKGQGPSDREHLGGKPQDFFKHAYGWSDWTGNMGTIHVFKIDGYEPETGRISGACAGRTGNRYYIENVAGYLNRPGEYCFDEEAGRMYVRLPDDRDPNGAALEVPRRVRLIDIQDQSHIDISGLGFRFNNLSGPTARWPPNARRDAAVRVAGHCSDVRVSHCTFRHLSSAFLAAPRLNREFTEIYVQEMLPWREDVMAGIAFTDNDLAYIDQTAVSLSEGRMLSRVELPPFGRLLDIEVLRNRLYHIGDRSGDGANSAIPAIGIYFPERAHIAGNILDRVWGSGIFVFGGKSSEPGDVPLTRILIHHNKITNAMLASNDYGGLEYWQGGPIYAYNNISGNSIGFKPNTPLDNDWKTVAYNVYLDGTFKSYTFNNIIWGKSNDPAYPYRNRGGYFVVLGFMDHFFNNTLYRFRHGIVGSSGNRCSYLGNLLTDMSGSFIQQNRAGDTSLRGGGDTGDMGARGMPSNAYARNLFHGDAPIGGAREIQGDSVEQMRARLEKIGARGTQAGWRADTDPLVDPAAFDFRLRPGSEAIDRGVRFFVPWALSGTVGEWNFIRMASSPETVAGENFFMTDEWIERHMYDLVPRNDLQVPGADADDYIAGPLEDWADGALRFNGTDRFGVLPHAEAQRDVQYPYAVQDGKVARARTAVSGAGRPSVDMGENNFLIETFFKTDPGAKNGTLAGKMDERGYALAIDGEGRAAFFIRGDGEALVTGTQPVNDGQWHHLIAEADRVNGTLRLYLDGRLDTEVAATVKGPLSSGADFLVGKSARDSHWFAGAIDFLRVARGTLADAHTTIDELYAWQFDGPFLRDFAGNAPTGKRRDIGAMELQ